jgi:hypothetical protein
MSESQTRRKFLWKSALASSAAALSFRFEEQALVAQQSQIAATPAAPQPSLAFPRGKLGKLSVSRLICGGNLISGFAHSRDLLYVSSLLRHYFTDEKVLETLALCEAHRLNTVILRVDSNTLRILDTHRKRGGKLQWIAQVVIKDDDFSEIGQAIDRGAVAVFTHGGVGDSLVEQGKVEVLGKAIELIKRKGAVAGVAGHVLNVVKTCEQSKLAPDFYMKTFNSKRYWSAGPMPRHDSVFEETPEETKAFMEQVDRPWIAYKVLGAGAIHPVQGFRYAFQNGADFICVGMFDFQVAEDVTLAREAVGKSRSRGRPWCG